MRVFVTGGTGFIGRHVCAALLAGGHELRVLTRDRARAAFLDSEQVLVGALCHERAAWAGKLRYDFDPQACVHLAWDGLPDYSPEACARNYDATLFLYRVLSQSTRVVGVGSCFEYGGLQGCVREADAPPQLGTFAAYKMACRLAGEHARGERFVWVRPFYVYGPGQRPSSLLPTVYANLKAGRPEGVRSPLDCCDFVHVEDVAFGIAALACNPAARGVYNLGTGRVRRVAHVVNAVHAALGRPLEEAPYPEVSDLVPFGASADCTRVREACAWEPLALEEGVRRTVAAWEGTA